MVDDKGYFTEMFFMTGLQCEHHLPFLIAIKELLKFYSDSEYCYYSWNIYRFCKSSLIFVKWVKICINTTLYKIKFINICEYVHLVFNLRGYPAAYNGSFTHF